MTGVLAGFSLRFLWSCRVCYFFDTLCNNGKRKFNLIMGNLFFVAVSKDN